MSLQVKSTIQGTFTDTSVNKQDRTEEVSSMRHITCNTMSAQQATAQQADDYLFVLLAQSEKSLLHKIAATHNICFKAQQCTPHLAYLRPSLTIMVCMWLLAVMAMCLQ